MILERLVKLEKKQKMSNSIESSPNISFYKAIRPNFKITKLVKNYNQLDFNDTCLNINGSSICHDCSIQKVIDIDLEYLVHFPNCICPLCEKCRFVKLELNLSKISLNTYSETFMFNAINLILNYGDSYKQKAFIYMQKIGFDDVILLFGLESIVLEDISSFISLNVSLADTLLKKHLDYLGFITTGQSYCKEMWNTDMINSQIFIPYEYLRLHLYTKIRNKDKRIIDCDRIMELFSEYALFKSTYSSTREECHFYDEFARILFTY